MKKSIHLKYYLRGLGVGIVVTTLIMGIVTGREKERLSDSEIRERARALGMTEQSTVLADTLKEMDEETDTGNQEPEGDSKVSPAEQKSPSPTPLETMAVPGMEAQPSPSASSIPSGTVSSPAATAKPSPTPKASPTPSPVRESMESADSSAEGTGSVPSPMPSAGADSSQENVSGQESGEAGSEQTGSEQAGGTAEGSVTIEVVSGDGSFSVSRKLEAAGVVASASEFDTYLCQNGYDRSIRTGSYAIPVNASQEQIAKILLRME